MKKRKDGLYQLTEVMEIAGEKKRKVFYGKTIAECKRKRDEFITAQDPELLTFGQAVKLYKKLEESRINSAAYNTKSERLEYFTALMPVKLSAITPKMIAVEINRLAVKNPKTGKPSAKRTLNRYLSAVSNVFDYAISERLASYNPCRFVKVPQNAPVCEREALLPAEYKLILSSNNNEFLAAKIMILCGLRRGELTALTFNDVSDRLNVNKSYDFKSCRVKLPKSRSGIRSVPVPEILKPELQKLKETHPGTDYVIGGNKMMTEAQWLNLRKRMIKQLGFEFSWHQLRHTYATILYDAGVDVLSAQRFLGHSDVKVTLGIYTSLSEKKQQLSIDNLDRFLA